MGRRWNKDEDQFIIKQWFDDEYPAQIAKNVEAKFGFRCTAAMVIGRIYRLREGAVSVPPRRPAVVSVRRCEEPYRTDWQRIVIPGPVSMPRVEWGGKLL